MATIPLTRRGFEKLTDELARLKNVERHAVIPAISESRAQGDLSENAEYEAAKDKQGFIEGRILEIESKLAAAQVIDPSTPDAEGRVVFGSPVDPQAAESGPAVRTRSSVKARPTRSLAPPPTASPGARFARWISAGSFTSHACMPDGRQSSEPRWLISAKRKPPLP